MLAKGVREVLDAFVKGLGHAPGWWGCLRSCTTVRVPCPDDALTDAHPDEIVGFVERPRARSRTTKALADLNDGPYVAASRAFNEWWQAGPGVPIHRGAPRSQRDDSAPFGAGVKAKPAARVDLRSSLDRDHSSAFVRTEPGKRRNRSQPAGPWGLTRPRSFRDDLLIS